MPIRFLCQNPLCGKAIVAGEDSAGRKARCPHCATVQAVPAAASEAGAGTSNFQSGGASPAQGAGRSDSAARAVRSCPNCGTVFEGATCPRCRNRQKTYLPPRANVGRWVLIAVGALAVAGLIWALAFVVKQFAAGPLEYQRQVAQTPKTVQGVMTKMNLASIGKAIRVYSAVNGSYPAILEQLVSGGLVPEAMLQARTPGKTLAYVAGQSDLSPGDNILVYEEQPGPDGLCDVLRISGQVQSLSPDQLRAALEQTKSQVRPREGS
jgi:phage FluMu protein Com